MIILEHLQCERGTASLIYLDAQGPWSEPGGVSVEHGALLRRVQERLLSSELPEKRVSYDPALDRVQL